MKNSFFVFLLLTSVFSGEASAALSFSSTKRPQARMIQTQTYLSENNKYLRQALVIHNMLNQLPGLMDVAETADGLSGQRKVLSEQLKIMDDCFAKKLSKMYKEPAKAWSKMTSTYERNRQSTPKKTGVESLAMSSEDLLKERQSAWYLNRDVLLDVYQNPEKYGATNDDGSFALWKDQITLYNKQWNDFYEKVNAQFGVALKGRPAVEEEVRYNPKKYDEVLQAHKAYLAGLKKYRQADFKELPPKAPEALPNVNNLVFVDQTTKKIYPELPEIWKSKENQQILAQSGGEFSGFFEQGDVNRPIASAGQMQKGDLETSYDVRLALDSLEKGSASIDGTLGEMRQKFLKKLQDLGIQTQDLTLASKGDYGQVRKLLKDKKKEMIQQAYDYVSLLEKQDLEHPELTATRQKRQHDQNARLSKEAQAAVKEVDQGIISIGQMSPVAQQKLVLAALEKDADGLTYLTETNAMNVDQMMRERHSSNKLIAESQKQVREAIKQQNSLMPRFKECPF